MRERKNMKLAELLLERKQCQDKIIDLKVQILSNLKVQEGDQNCQSVDTLLKEFEMTNDHLHKLIIQINQINCRTVVPSGALLIEAIAQRDKISSKITLYKEIIKASNQKDYRSLRSEIKTILNVNIDDVKKEIDNLSKQYRVLDTEIQMTNWNTDI